MAMKRKQEPKKDLPSMRENNDPQKIQWQTGRSGSVQQESILQQEMYGERLYEIGDNIGRCESEEQKICKRTLRDMRNDEESSSTSYGYESLQQCAGEYYDTLPVVPHKIPLGAWENIDAEVCNLLGEDDLNFIINHYWETEPDIPRVAAGVPNRVGRLKALGNAVVPQQFYPFFKAIANVIEETV